MGCPSERITVCAPSFSSYCFMGCSSERIIDCSPGYSSGYSSGCSSGYSSGCSAVEKHIFGTILSDMFCGEMEQCHGTMSVFLMRQLSVFCYKKSEEGIASSTHSSWITLPHNLQQ